MNNPFLTFIKSYNKWLMSVFCFKLIFANKLQTIAVPLDVSLPPSRGHLFEMIYNVSYYALTANSVVFLIKKLMNDLFFSITSITSVLFMLFI